MADATDVNRAIRGKRRPGREREVADLAGRQHGVVSRTQLLSLGVSPDRIDRGLSSGRLHRLHRAVYAVGHRRLSQHGRWLAAVLAAGAGAVLSHRSAARLWRLLPFAPTTIELTAPRERRSRPGLRIRCTALPADELARVDGIPVTTVPRTLFDLAGVVSSQALARAFNEAEVLRLTDPLSPADLLARYPGRPGAPAVRALLDAQPAGPTITRSELEWRFLEFLDSRGLPRPAMNVPLQLGGRLVEVDCLWREQRLVVELDGHAFHAGRRAFEEDRERDRLLHVSGLRPVRVTWDQLSRRADALKADLLALLGNAR